MNPISTVTPAAIPPDILGALVPGALFAVWSVLVVAVVVWLCVVLGMERRAEAERRQPIRVAPRRLTAAERSAA